MIGINRNAGEDEIRKVLRERLRQHLLLQG
jgi:hypothetical protein